MNRSGYFKVLFCSKAGGYLLTAGLERTVAPLAAPAAAQAIVVLTGGHWRNMEAVRLQRATGLPVLASGGDGDAAAIKTQLERDFGVPLRWTEGDLLTTEENALFSDTGLEVIPAPTDFSSAAVLQWENYWPSAEGRKTSQSALHEMFGLAWYRMRQLIPWKGDRGWRAGIDCGAPDQARNDRKQGKILLLHWWLAHAVCRFSSLKCAAIQGKP